MKKGQVKTSLVAVDDFGYGDKVEKIINICTEGNIVYANLAQKTVHQSYDGSDWSLVEQSGEDDYKVYIDKTVDEVVALYKQHTTDTVTWIVPLTEV